MLLEQSQAHTRTWISPSQEEDKLSTQGQQGQQLVHGLEAVTPWLLPVDPGIIASSTSKNWHSSQARLAEGRGQQVVTPGRREQPEAKRLVPKRLHSSTTPAQPLVPILH